SQGLESQGKKVAEEREGRLKEAKIGDNNEELAIARLEVSSEVVDALVNRGITQLFPIQKAVLEPSMTRRNLIARAKTGTGKTLAFKTSTSCHQNGISQMAVDKVGKICTIDDPQVNWAVFDVPEDVAEELLKLPANSEIVIHVLKM
ncbi:unnamed protein product, partial [Sphagnum jensenii]